MEDVVFVFFILEIKRIKEECNKRRLFIYNFRNKENRKHVVYVFLILGTKRIKEECKTCRLCISHFRNKENRRRVKDMSSLCLSF